jgi:hypothetical protein
MSRNKLIFNFLLFQTGWFICILLDTWIALASTFAILAIHFRVMGCKVDILLIAASLPTGFVIDSTLQASGIIDYKASEIFQPIWLTCLWALFSITLNHSLKWVVDSFPAALIGGAIFGPLSYSAGAALGAATLPENTLLSFLVLSATWAALMSTISLCFRLQRPNQQSPSGTQTETA